MEGKIMKQTIGVALILGMILLIPAYPSAETAILDEGSPNFDFARLRWDFRDYGSLDTDILIGGSRLRTGAFFVFECEIVTVGDLNDIGDVTKVVAVNTLSDRQYILHYDPFYFEGFLVQYWLLLVQANQSMFDNEYEFILHYNDSDGNPHQQIKIASPPEKVFPAEIGEVAVNRIQGYFEVSWSGIGEPGPEINYHVLVVDNTGLDVFEFYYPGYYGFYDSSSNKLFFYIPQKYGGKKYGLRLANGIFTNRSLYYMTLQDLDD